MKATRTNVSGVGMTTVTAGNDTVVGRGGITFHGTDGVNVSLVDDVGGDRVSVTVSGPDLSGYATNDSTNGLSEALNFHVNHTDVHGVQGEVVGTDSTQTLKHKTISGLFNTITAITDACLSPGINAAKIGDGSVSNEEFQRLNGVTGNVQDQLDGKANLDEVEDLIGDAVGGMDLSAYMPKAGGTFTGDVTLDNGAGETTLRAGSSTRRGTIALGDGFTISKQAGSPARFTTSLSEFAGDLIASNMMHGYGGSFHSWGGGPTYLCSDQNPKQPVVIGSGPSDGVPAGVPNGSVAVTIPLYAQVGLAVTGDATFSGAVHVPNAVLENYGGPHFRLRGGSGTAMILDGGAACLWSNGSEVARAVAGSLLVGTEANPAGDKLLVAGSARVSGPTVISPEGATYPHLDVRFRDSTHDLSMFRVESRDGNEPNVCLANQPLVTAVSGTWAFQGRPAVFHNGLKANDEWDTTLNGGNGTGTIYLNSRTPDGSTTVGPIVIGDTSTALPKGTPAAGNRVVELAADTIVRAAKVMSFPGDYLGSAMLSAADGFRYAVPAGGYGDHYVVSGTHGDMPSATPMWGIKAGGSAILPGIASDNIVVGENGAVRLTPGYFSPDAALLLKPNRTDLGSRRAIGIDQAGGTEQFAVLLDGTVRTVGHVTSGGTVRAATYRGSDNGTSDSPVVQSGNDGNVALSGGGIRDDSIAFQWQRQTRAKMDWLGNFTMPGLTVTGDAATTGSVTTARLKVPGASGSTIADISDWSDGSFVLKAQSPHAQTLSFLPRDAFLGGNGHSTIQSNVKMFLAADGGQVLLLQGSGAAVLQGKSILFKPNADPYTDNADIRLQRFDSKLPLWDDGSGGPVTMAICSNGGQSPVTMTSQSQGRGWQFSGGSVGEVFATGAFRSDQGFNTSTAGNGTGLGAWGVGKFGGSGARIYFGGSASLGEFMAAQVAMPDGVTQVEAWQARSRQDGGATVAINGAAFDGKSSLQVGGTVSVAAAIPTTDRTWTDGLAGENALINFTNATSTTAAGIAFRADSNSESHLKHYANRIEFDTYETILNSTGWVTVGGSGLLRGQTFWLTGGRGNLRTDAANVDVLTWAAGQPVTINPYTVGQAGPSLLVNGEVGVTGGITAGPSNIGNGSGYSYITNLRLPPGHVVGVDAGGGGGLRSYSYGQIALDNYYGGVRAAGGQYQNAATSSGTFNFFEVEPTVAQSGTAGYAGLKVNVIETSTGSGQKLLIDAQVGGARKFSVDRDGVTNQAGGATFGDRVSAPALALRAPDGTDRVITLAGGNNDRFNFGFPLFTPAIINGGAIGTGITFNGNSIDLSTNGVNRINVADNGATTFAGNVSIIGGSQSGQLTIGGGSDSGIVYASTYHSYTYTTHIGSDQKFRIDNNSVGNVFLLDLAGNATVRGGLSATAFAGSGQSLTNIGNASLVAGIDAAKIGAGNVGNTEFGYLDGATGNIQAQINALAGGSSVTPGGAAYQLQYNDGNGGLAGAAGVTTDGGSLYVDGNLRSQNFFLGNNATGGGVIYLYDAPGDTYRTITQGDDELQFAGNSSYTFSGGVSAQSFYGSGSGLTNLPAGSLTGTVNAARLPTGIDAAKIGGGTVSNAEFAFLDGVTSGVQGQLNAKAPLASPSFSGTVAAEVVTIAQRVRFQSDESIYGTWDVRHDASSGDDILAFEHEVFGRLFAIDAVTQEANLFGSLGVQGTATAGYFVGNGQWITSLNASSLAAGSVPMERLGSGSRPSGSFLREDGSWAVPAGGGGGGDYLPLSGGTMTGAIDMNGQSISNAQVVYSNGSLIAQGYTNFYGSGANFGWLGYAAEFQSLSGGVPAPMYFDASEITFRGNGYSQLMHLGTSGDLSVTGAISGATVSAGGGYIGTDGTVRCAAYTSVGDGINWYIDNQWGPNLRSPQGTSSPFQIRSVSLLVGLGAGGQDWGSGNVWASGVVRSGSIASLYSNYSVDAYSANLPSIKIDSSYAYDRRALETRAWTAMATSTYEQFDQVPLPNGNAGWIEYTVTAVDLATGHAQYLRYRFFAVATTSAQGVYQQAGESLDPFGLGCSLNAAFSGTTMVAIIQQPTYRNTRINVKAEAHFGYDGFVPNGYGYGGGGGGGGYGGYGGY